MIKDFVNLAAPEKNIQVRLSGFRKEYNIDNTDVHVTTVLSDNEYQISPKDVEAGVKVPSNVLKVKDL